MTVRTLQGGFFGKLPTAADFVSHNAGGAGSGPFQQWLLDGVALTRERLSDRWPVCFEAFGGYRFVFRSGDRGPVVVGVLRASRDESGRTFPMAVFAEAEPAPGDGFDEFPDAYDGILKRSAALLDEAGDAAALRVSVDSPFPDRDGGMDLTPRVADLDAALGADGTVARAAVNLVELAQRVSKWQAWTPDFALRFPIPEGSLGRSAAGLWVRLCRAALGPGEGMPALFWSEGGGRLDLYYHPPAPLAFLFLTDPDLDSDHVYPVHAEAAPSVYLAPGAPGSDAASRLADTGQSLAELVAAVVAVAPRSGT